MLNIITLKIKKLRRIKSFLFKLLNRLNREPNLFFHSHNAALAELSRKHQKKHTQLTTTNFFSSLIDGISIHEEVISYPLIRNKAEGEFSWYGGLINIRTHELIEEAIHSSWGSLLQKLPPSLNAQEIFRTDILEIEDTVFFGGILFNQFGHFLLDSLSRLWAYEFVKELDPYIVFYTPWGIPNFLEKNNYVNQVLTGFNIPLKRLVFINDLIKLKKVIVPHQKYGTDYAKNPDSVFLNFVNNFRFKNDIPTGFANADRIYVSRSKMPIDSGRVIAENIFEEYLISNGYKIFYPEFYNLFQQLTIYNNAKKIIFCSGSTLHGCILLPNLQADVAIIARWQDPGANLFHTEQFKGYAKAVLGVDALRGQYQFGSNYARALSDVDWYKASILLERQGFVDTPFNNFNQLDYSNLERCELQSYIQAKSKNSDFIDFMMKFKERET